MKTSEWNIRQIADGKAVSSFFHQLSPRWREWLTNAKLGAIRASANDLYINIDIFYLQWHQQRTAASPYVWEAETVAENYSRYSSLTQESMGDTSYEWFSLFKFMNNEQLCSKNETSNCTLRALSTQPVFHVVSHYKGNRRQHTLEFKIYFAI